MGHRELLGSVTRGRLGKEVGPRICQAQEKGGIEVQMGDTVRFVLEIANESR